MLASAGVSELVGEEEYQVAYYNFDGKYWLVCGSEQHFEEEDFVDIKERKIK